MDLTRDPSVIANAAADEIRTLNHRTLEAKAFPQPGDVSDTANAVARLVQMLPQALQQMDVALLDLEQRQAIRMDDGADVVVSVATVGSHLMKAREFLSQAHRELQGATSPLSHMGGLWEDEEPNSTDA